MAKQAVVTSKLKNNGNKHEAAHTEWMKAKKLGRTKQKHVDVRTPLNTAGVWEKIA